MKNSDKKIKIFTSLAIVVAMSVFAVSALAAADLSFSFLGGTTYKVGDTFRMAIMISPTEKIYTVKAQASYPANLLKIESFTFNQNWWPLSQPGYDVVDNNAGLLIKTAGYPDGTNVQQIILGTATFRVLNPGNANLKFTSDSLILNANNANVVGSLASLDLTLTSVSVPTPPAEEGAPEEEITPEEATPSEEIVQPKSTIVISGKELVAEIIAAPFSLKMLLIGAGVIIIGLIILWLVRRKRKPVNL